MKFWEALREMEAGAECQAMIGNTIPGLRHRWSVGRLEVWDDEIKEWKHSPATVNGSRCDWRVVMPAPAMCEPVESKPQSTWDAMKDIAALQDQIIAMRRRIEALEANKAQPPAPDEKWPKGSLQFERTMARLLGFRFVKRSSWLSGRIDVQSACSLTHDDLMAIDWEPCE